MSVTYDIFPGRGFMIVWYAGRISVDDSMRVFSDSTRDPRWEPGLPVLVDASEATDIDINFNQMLGMSHRKQAVIAQGPRTRIGFWAPHDLAYGVARMYASLNEGDACQEIGVFRDRDEAMAFLGISNCAS